MVFLELVYLISKWKNILLIEECLKWRLEGVEFRVNSHIGKDIKIEELNKDFDSIAFCGGSENPRDLPVKGRELKGIYFAMEFLSQQNDRVAGNKIDPKVEISAKGKECSCNWWWRYWI